VVDAAIFDRDRSRWRSTAKLGRARLHWKVLTERIADVGGPSDHIHEDARSHFTPICSTASLVEKRLQVCGRAAARSWDSRSRR
jgi:hypothetical protein